MAVPGIRDTVPRFSVVILLIIFALPAGASAAGGATDALERLLDAGAPQLALRFIDEEQPDYTQSVVAWQRWERRRLAILESRKDWRAVIERVDAYPPSLPDDFWIFSHEAAARAHLGAGDAARARARVAALIWSTAQETAFVAERRARLMRWRALLAESYLLEGAIGDAETTRLRFRLDYADDPAGWRLAEARAQIRARHDARARELLAGIESTEVAYLSLLLDAREPGADPVDLLSQMGPFLGEGRLVAGERSELWASLAHAAARYRDGEVRVVAMEQALSLRARSHARDALVAIDGDDLWDAYESYALALANEAHLLVGSFDAWLALAEDFDGAGDVRARALYAYLAGQDRNARVTGVASARLAAALAREPRGLRMLAALYLDSRRYPDIAAIPLEVRAPLIEHAIARSRPEQAGQLLAGLDAKARAALPAAWRTPVAVALIDEGRIDEALDTFGGDFVHAPLAPADAARVALALQRAGEYARAAKLLAGALAVTEDASARRALLLLAAESEDGAGRPVQAARLYIESAAVPGGGSADAWSRAARVQAARALMQAGLRDDAEGVLREALADSARPDARVYVEHMLRRF